MEEVKIENVIATYDDACLYALKQTEKLAKKTFDSSGGVETLLLLEIGGAVSSAMVETIAFIYGKTPEQVIKDAKRKDR